MRWGRADIWWRRVLLVGSTHSLPPPRVLWSRSTRVKRSWCLDLVAVVLANLRHRRSLLTPRSGSNPSRRQEAVYSSLLPPVMAATALRWTR